MHTAGITASALEMAYKLPKLKTIILFTDGRPTGPQGIKFEESEVKRVYDLCEKHAGIPVHIVGLGDYFIDKKFSEFLRNRNRNRNRDAASIGSPVAALVSTLLVRRAVSIN